MLENPTVWLWPEFLQNLPALSLADCWHSWLYCICLSHCTSILNWALQHCIVMSKQLLSVLSTWCLGKVINRYPSKPSQQSKDKLWALSIIQNEKCSCYVILLEKQIVHQTCCSSKLQYIPNWKQPWTVTLAKAHISYKLVLFQFGFESMSIFVTRFSRVFGSCWHLLLTLGWYDHKLFWMHVT